MKSKFQRLFILIAALVYVGLPSYAGSRDDAIKRLAGQTAEAASESTVKAQLRAQAQQDALLKELQAVETSRAARREAMRTDGIPTSQQPSFQGKNDSGYFYIYNVPKSGGGTFNKGVAQQTLDRSHLNQPHWEAGTIRADPYNKYGGPRLTYGKAKVNY